MRTFVTFGLAGLAFALPCTSSYAQSGTGSPTTVLVDRHLSPAAGATVTNALARVLAHTEDRFIPLRLFEERGKVRGAVNATYRLAKLALFDEPQENWFRVLNHEVFGHGARLRERFAGRIGYELPAPPPYGRGGGATFFEFSRPPTVEEVFAVTVGGMEANYVLARSLARDALTEGAWHYRDARRYLYAEYDTIRYIRGVHTLEKEGHDVGDFIRTFNEGAGESGGKPVSARQLRRNVLASFANPLIAYSYYSTFVSYVWSGKTSAPVPAIRLGSTRYLPMVRYHLTSFGTEFVLDNTFVRNGRFFDVIAARGATIGARTWSVGVQGTRLATIKQWTLDGEGTVWRRPAWGSDVSVSARYAIARRRGHTIALVVQGGAKGFGYTAGDPLRKGLFARVGAVFIPGLIPTSPQSP